MRKISQYTIGFNAGYYNDYKAYEAACKLPTKARHAFYTGYEEGELRRLEESESES